MDSRNMAISNLEQLSPYSFWWQETFPGFEDVHLNSESQADDGKIYVMYHGTNLSAARQIIGNGFHRSADGMLGEGVYVTRDQDKAARYPLGDKSDQVILKLRVSVGKVIKIDCQGHRLQKTWQYNGYDTAWVPPNCGMVESELEEDCVWNPKRISVIGVEKAPQCWFQYLQHSVSLHRARHNHALHISSIAWHFHVTVSPFYRHLW